MPLKEIRFIPLKRGGNLQIRRLPHRPRAGLRTMHENNAFRPGRPRDRNVDSGPNRCADRKRLIAALVEVTVACAAPVLLPIAHRRDRQLLHERTYVPGILRPQYKSAGG